MTLCCVCVQLELTLRCGFFFQAEDGIRDLVRSRGLGDVYKRQGRPEPGPDLLLQGQSRGRRLHCLRRRIDLCHPHPCLLYTSDAADDLLCVDLGGRRIIKKKKWT